jgi:pyridoxal phosphate enzyme (YggS family)
MYQNIQANVCNLLAEIPPNVTIVAAAKGRSPGEISAALDAGISVIGENYVQEAEPAKRALGKRANWHFIGHLQMNKVARAVEIFDLIETIDNRAIAEAVNRHAADTGKIMPVLIEVNVGREPWKSGVLPESVADLARKIALLGNLRLLGLMTLGPKAPSEKLRPFFAETRRLFCNLQQLYLPGTDIRCLSMGMSDSYKAAIEEGANTVRLGTAIFGPRL